jgi:hypothetical protein
VRFLGGREEDARVARSDSNAGYIGSNCYRWSRLCLARVDLRGCEESARKERGGSLEDGNKNDELTRRTSSRAGTCHLRVGYLPLTAPFLTPNKVTAIFRGSSCHRFWVKQTLDGDGHEATRPTPWHMSLLPDPKAGVFLSRPPCSMDLPIFFF